MRILPFAASLLGLMAVIPSAGRAQEHALRSSDIAAALGFPPVSSTSTRLCTGTAGQASGCATLDANAKVAAGSLISRPAITPLTTMVGTSATTIFNAQTFLSISITLETAGVQLACTGDGSTPVIGTSVTVLGLGQSILWLPQEGYAPPSGAVKCVATGTATISVVAI